MLFLWVECQKSFFVIVLKHLIRKYTPKPGKLREQKSLSVLGEHVYSPSLWHVTRRSIAGAIAVGLFCAWMPIPGQMLIAAAIAIIFTVNLPVAIATVWFSNPVTMPLMFYGAYWLGAKILGVTLQNIEFELSWQWLSTTLHQIWQPLLLGCFIMAVIHSVIGYFAVKAIWRYNTVRKLQKKRNKKKKS